MTRFWLERARMQAREQRDRQLTEMGKVSATILHELAKPLSRIVMVADQAIEGTGSEREALQQVLGDARMTRELSDQLMGAVKLDIERASVTPHRIVSDLKTQTDSEGIPLLIELAPGLEKAVGNWDAGLIVTALLNLARNAWESQAASGEAVGLVLELSSGRTQDRSPGNGMLMFIIKDRGQGLPPDVGADIFSALYSTKESGFGIGLFLVHQVAIAHDGRLHAVNRQGGGAEFSLELPLQGI